MTAFMKATLWDGMKQLHGRIELMPDCLMFSLLNFSKSSLNLEIPYSEIEKVKLYRVYKIALEGLEIVTKDGGQNIFISDESKRLRKLIVHQLSVTEETKTNINYK